MFNKFSQLAALALGAAAALTAVSSMACSLVPMESIALKQMMAKEIAYKLGKKPEDIPLNAITEPQLKMPLGLGADCSGFWALHYSAGFRFVESWRIEPGPLPGSGRWSGQWPQYAQCSYEGMAVILGFTASSPVAVNFMQKCE